MNMVENLSKFSVFLLQNATLNDAIEFAKGFHVSEKGLYIYDDLKISDVVAIKDKAFDQLKPNSAFLIGKANIEAQNSLLKLLENPPPNNYFILYEAEYMLETIVSRSQIINFKIQTLNVLPLIDAYLNNDGTKFLQELISIKEESKNNKALLLSYLKSIIKLFAQKKFAKQAYLLSEEYFNLRDYNININLFIVRLYVILWRNKLCL